jgi:BNR repeat-like domain
LTRSKTLLFVLVVAAIAAATLTWVSFGRVRSSISFEPQPHPVIENATAPAMTMTTSDKLYLLAAEGHEENRHLVLMGSFDGGDTFTKLGSIGDEGSAVMAHGEMGPRLRAKAMYVYALWQAHPAQGPSLLQFARSSNSGQSFDPPINVVDKPAGDTSFQGFADFTLSPKGDVIAAWLDGRDSAMNHGTFSVYVARSTDKGVSFGKNVRVGAGGCPCCRPAVMANERGDVFVAWRKVFEGDQRDIVVSTSHDGGQTFGDPVRVFSDRWVLHACPESGPSLAWREGKLYVAWYSGADKPGVRVAVSGDSGKSFLPPHEIEDKVLDQNHPSLSLSEDGRLLLSFLGRAKSDSSPWQSLQPFVTEVAQDGALSSIAAVPASGAGAVYPAVVAGSAGRIFLAEASGNVLLLRGRLQH